ncbi:hypothetical protein [Luteolibacter sp. Populi]|uniref:hypothetical protein n=1 Tax=Luteolibacter sp. Populi TaxID=3230487 RepID=UPI0034676481
MNPRYLCLSTCLFAVSPQADAAIFAREDFNYSNGNLAGSNGGLGWTSAWTNAGGTPVVTGSKGKVDSVANQQGARLISTLQEPPVGGTKVVWISFEGKQTTNVAGTTSTASFGGLGLYRGNTEQLLIGKSWPGDYQWKAGAGQGLIGPVTPVSTLSLTNVVARITMADPGVDTLDVWLNPADTSTVAALGTPHITRTDPDLSFNTLRIRSGEGDAGVTAESWEFDAVAAGDDLADVVASDSDGDQMLDAWETANGLIVGIDDSAGDEGDHDDSPNLEEFQRSTNPNDPDTDHDGLWDKVESDTGTFVSATNTGTDPVIADTDGDTLLDGEEDNSGVFTDAFDPGTNPNLADSDSDTHRDDYEILRGSNPNSAASVPQTGDLAIVGSDDFSTYADGPVAGLDGGNGFDYDNSTANNSFVGHVGLGSSDWDFSVGVSEVVGGKLRTMDSGAKREFSGPGEGNAVGSDEHSGAVNDTVNSVGRTVYFRADLKRGTASTWSGISAFDFGTERAFVGVVDAVNPASGNREFAIGAPSATPVYSGVQPLTGRDYTLVVKLDFESDLISLWVNPDLAAAEAAPLISAPFLLTNWITAARLGSGGTDATEWDQFVVAREWSALSVFPGVIPPTDDYLAWISGFEVGGETGFDDDSDGDGLANGVEHVLGTSPAVTNAGLREVAGASATSFRFHHSRTNALATDVAASYEWSTDLVNWHASGETNAGGTTATIASSAVVDAEAPGLDEIEVEVSVTAGASGGMFARLKSTQP